MVIAIFTYERTGSGWLCETFDSDNTISLHEVFNDNPLLTYNIFNKLYFNSTNFPGPISNCFKKIYYPGNFNINKNSNIEIKKKILQNKPYSFDFLKEIIKETKKLNKNCVFKIHPHHLDNDITIEKIIEVSDYFIFNYRNNILKSFISFEISKKTDVWFLKNNSLKRREPLIWDKSKYISYMESILNVYNFWLDIFNKIQKPKTIISYEKIHEDNMDELSKISHIESLINNKDIILNYKNSFVKQNDYNNYADIFLNYDNFLQSLNEGLKININE
jgi:LPS sulfotransferase NodH